MSSEHREEAGNVSSALLKSQHTDKDGKGHLGKSGSMICVKVHFLGYGWNLRV